VRCVNLGDDAATEFSLDFEAACGVIGSDPMIVQGILNPQLLSLLARVRHTNTVVIADRGFPFWPGIETVDISLVDGVPTVLQVLAAVRANHVVTEAFMAEEFARENTPATQAAFAAALAGIKVGREAHGTLKQRVPGAIGLIRTGDITQYSNLVLVSG
jgi:D-ribose pyranase